MSITFHTFDSSETIEKELQANFSKDQLEFFRFWETTNNENEKNT